MSVMNRSVFALASILSLSFAAGCGDDSTDNTPGGDGVVEIPDDPFNVRRCPEIADNAAMQMREGFTNEANYAAYGRAIIHDKSYGRDVVGNENAEQVLVGQYKRSKNNTPGTGIVIAGETVKFFAERDGAWAEIGSTTTDAQGMYRFEIPAASAFEPGSHRVLAILEASGVCNEHGVFLWPANSQSIITDIDGTLSASDNEFITQLFKNINYVPENNIDAPRLVQTWTGKDYGVVYLTARPNEFRWMSRVWLREQGYTFGPMETAESFVFGETARAYKRAFVELAKNTLKFDVVAAYGNAQSDVDAYEDGGIPKAITFTINEAEGASGTVGIPDGSFTAHIDAVVTPFPKAAQGVQNIGK